MYYWEIVLLFFNSGFLQVKSASYLIENIVRWDVANKSVFKGNKHERRCGFPKVGLLLLHVLMSKLPLYTYSVSHSFLK